MTAFSRVGHRQLFTCATCGAVVDMATATAHDDWHRALSASTTPESAE